MCERCADVVAGHAPLARRGIFKLAAMAAVGLALSPEAFAKESPPKPQNVLSPDAALERLMRGNSGESASVMISRTSASS